MEKIGRNDLCPCGSGKKYKKCHLRGTHKDITAPQKNKVNMNFDNLLNTHNSIQILGLLGALQLHVENHGRNFRFEQLCLATLRKFDPNDIKQLATWGQLKNSIENYTDGAMMEDPLSNAYTETAIFQEGNYIVYPGIYDGFTEILNNLTECIFLHKHNLNEDFVNNVKDAVGLLLLMSNQAARNAGHKANLINISKSQNIQFPEHEKARIYTDAIYFEYDYLKEVCDNRNYDITILNEFLIHPDSKELEEDDPEENIVNFKPLIKIQDNILMYMPTGIANALVSYIYRKAKEHNCHDELKEIMYDRQFRLSCVALSKTGWMATDIELPALKNNIPVKETVFQFDNQKLAYVCYIKPGGEGSEQDEEMFRPKTINPFEKRSNEVVEYLSNIDSRQNFSVFCLYIIGETADDFYFMWNKPSAGNQSIALKYRELLTIAYSPKVDGFTLWKFAKCYRRTHEIARIMSVGGTMDAYVIYRNNHGSLLHSDHANPLGGMLLVAYGSSDEFRREIQIHQNVHAVPIFHEGTLAYAKVSRFKDYAPIYVEQEFSKYFRIVIENFKMPIWITSPQTRSGKESFATYACEAVAFWLNKMEPLLGQYINSHSYIQFEIEIVAPDKVMDGGEFEIKDIDVNSLKLDIEIIAPCIRISLPMDFLNAVLLSDNTADKLLMKTVLQGIVAYISASGKTTLLNDEIINEVVEKTLQPSGAKMILFNDAASNIMMDNRNLPPLRYINDTDISFILDNLVSYLPKGYVIPEEIKEKTDKIKLCDDIVSALTNQITIRIKEFDGQDLIKWLIRLNEKCIQVREFREILIPARIACFSSFQNEVDDLMDGERNLVTTAHATRTLIEFVAINPPTGSKWLNIDDIDELLALTNLLTEWGALSEAIRMGIDNPKMGLLPSGRIGTDKTVEREAFKPYAIAKTESAIFKQIENFEKNYVSASKTNDAVETEESKLLDAAFKAEFQITLTVLSKVIGTLVNEGFQAGESCMKLSECSLKNLLIKIDGISEADVDTSLNLLTLLERKGIGIPPDGYTSIDIFPWRYNRPISFIRRPLVKFVKGEEVFYYFGYRHLMQFIENLFFLLHSSKLPGAKSDEMKSWLAAASGDKGKPFRAIVKEWFEENSDYKVIPYEVQMKAGVSKDHIQADKNYGDIDLLVIDNTTKIIYPIECKNIQGGRNVHEMKVEMDEYLGRDGNDKNAKIRKHLDRHNFLNVNKAGLKNFVSDADSYALKSFILTADEIPLAYLKKDGLSLPIKSFSFLRKNGISYLSDL